MEPLDQNLVSKFSKAIKKYEREEAILASERFKKNTKTSPINKPEDIIRRNRSDVRKFKYTADDSITEELFDLIRDTCLCTKDELKTSKRDHGVTVARAIFCYVERRLNKRSYPEIALLINKDHTSIMHLYDRFVREYRHTKIFQVYMKDDRLRDLVNRAMIAK